MKQLLGITQMWLVSSSRWSVMRKEEWRSDMKIFHRGVARFGSSGNYDLAPSSRAHQREKCTKLMKETAKLTYD